MAGPAFPSVQGLAQMEFLPAFAFQQARDQMGLANQFAQQELKIGEEDLAAKQLANLFNQQNNPQKLAHQKLINEGATTKNAADALEYSEKQATSEGRVKQGKAEALAKATAAELQQLQAAAQQDMMSGDPTRIARGTKLMDASWGELTRRREADEKKALKKMDIDADWAKTKMVQDRTDARQDKELSSRASRAASKAKGVQDLYQAAQSGKVPPDKMAVAFYARAADPDTDPEEVPRLLNAARTMEQMAQTLRAAGTPQRTDLNQMGIPTTQIQPTLPQGQLPQAGGQPVQQAPKAPATPQAPNGRVVIYKDGKAVGTVPAAQAAAAQAQGYTIK